MADKQNAKPAQDLTSGAGLKTKKKNSQAGQPGQPVSLAPDVKHQHTSLVIQEFASSVCNQVLTYIQFCPSEKTDPGSTD